MSDSPLDFWGPRVQGLLVETVFETCGVWARRLLLPGWEDPNPRKLVAGSLSRVTAEDRYDEIASEMQTMLLKVGWRKDVVEKQMPILPISGLVGDNLTKKSENMRWWRGCNVEVDIALEVLALKESIPSPFRDPVPMFPSAV